MPLHAEGQDNQRQTGTVHMRLPKCQITVVKAEAALSQAAAERRRAEAVLSQTAAGQPRAEAAVSRAVAGQRRAEAAVRQAVAEQPRADQDTIRIIHICQILMMIIRENLKISVRKSIR